MTPAKASRRRGFHRRWNGGRAYRGRRPSERSSTTRQAAICESLDDMVGATPLLRLPRTAEIEANVLLKLESMNPGGSVKDRTALALIEHGERTGKLRPGGVIVEPTSGNTGLGLAMLAARRGFKCVFTVMDKVSNEKVALLRAYGAEVIVCPTNVSPQDPSSYYSVAKEIAGRTPNSYMPEQYENLVNRQVHYEVTGPEIWRQTEGRITHFVCGAGTGGTISGVGRYLKEQSEAIVVICADPVGSIYSSPKPHSYLTEGVGEDFFPANFDPATVDSVVPVSDAEAFSTCHRVVQCTGLLTGGSGGMAIAVATMVAQGGTDRDLVVALIPDSGRAYVSKIYSRRWMLENGFSETGTGRSVGRELNWRDRVGGATLESIPAHTALGDALPLLLGSRFPSLPVSSSPNPKSLGDICGAISTQGCRELLRDRPACVGWPVRRVMTAPLPIVGVGQEVDDALTGIGVAKCFVLAEAGRPVAVVSTSDLFGSSLETIEGRLQAR